MRFREISEFLEIKIPDGTFAVGLKDCDSRHKISPNGIRARQTTRGNLFYEDPALQTKHKICDQFCDQF